MARALWSLVARRSSGTSDQFSLRACRRQECTPYLDSLKLHPHTLQYAHAATPYLLQSPRQPSNLAVNLFRLGPSHQFNRLSGIQFLLP